MSEKEEYMGPPLYVAKSDCSGECCGKLLEVSKEELKYTEDAYVHLSEYKTVSILYARAASDCDEAREIAIEIETRLMSMLEMINSIGPIDGCEQNMRELRIQAEEAREIIKKRGR